MENSLVLSHLPRAFTSHESLAFLRERLEPPPTGELAEALCRAGCDKRQVWETVHAARRGLEETFKRLSRNRRIKFVSYWEASYPMRLRLIEDAPWNIFFLGSLPNAGPSLGVVGTRKPDEYGIRLLADFLPNLKVRDLQMISGLAYGVDALAHFYACESRIPNFAVLGSGVDVLYPADHNELAARILDLSGGILSEYPPGTEPRPMHFPRRNRLISGLSDVVWIVQGTSKSGSLHTAKHAANQGKVVTATPGDLYSRLSDVPNRLIYDGAHVLLRPDDLELLLERPRATIAH